MSPSSFKADVSKWSAKALLNTKKVVLRSTERVYNNMTQTQPSVKFTGGSFVVGKVPVLKGDLIGSTILSVGGSPVSRGSKGIAASFGPVESNWKLGQDIEAVFTMGYAPNIEYGINIRGGGRFFRAKAVGEWPSIVASEAAKFK